MKKRIALLLVAVLTVSLLSGCCLKHDWMDADCTHPRLCSNCGKVEGNALGHDWEDATCAHPKLCSNCGKTRGEALEHAWVEATCKTAKYCQNCNTTEGTAPGHQLVDGVIDGDFVTGTCSVCSQDVSEVINWTTFPNSIIVGRWECILVSDGTNSIDAPASTYLELYADGTVWATSEGDEDDGTWEYDYHDTSDDDPCLFYDATMGGEDYRMLIFDDNLSYLYVSYGGLILVYEKN